MAEKTVAQSEVRTSKTITPYHCNSIGAVHAGEIMQMIYNTAYMAAKEHAQTNIVTAKVNELVFHYPIMVGNVVTCHAFLVFVGKSSMEVAVNVYVEGFNPKRLALTASLIMIGMDENRKPMEVPRLKLVSSEEKERFEAARLRYERYKKEKACAT